MAENVRCSALYTVEDKEEAREDGEEREAHMIATVLDPWWHWWHWWLMDLLPAPLAEALRMLSLFAGVVITAAYIGVLVRRGFRGSNHSRERRDEDANE